jgi:hypothetical protein
MLRKVTNALIRDQMDGPRDWAGAGLEGGSGLVSGAFRPKSLSFIV